jgi:hypothetical protein
MAGSAYQVQEEYVGAVEAVADPRTVTNEYGTAGLVKYS